MELANRDKIAKQMNVLWAGYEASEGSTPEREVVFEQAFSLVMRDDIKSVESRTLAEKVKSRSSQRIQRTTGNKAIKKLTPEEHTAALIDEKFS